MFFSGQELLRLVPGVLRAREYRLYLEGGKKLTDLWLAGGRALLGHKAPRVLGELKNAGERGLFVPLPHPIERRFFKALGEFFPGRSFRLYPDESSLLRALLQAGCAGPPFYDPAFPRAAEESLTKAEKTAPERTVSLWRPFVENSGGGEASVLIPVLPWPPGPAVLVLDETRAGSFPPGELIAPALLAPALRALYDLAAAVKARVSNREKGRYPKIEKALKNSRWSRRGIYLTRRPGPEAEEYKTLFLNFLEGGFLLPPSQGEPLILPPALSPGEESKLAGLLTKGE